MNKIKHITCIVLLLLMALPVSVFASDGSKLNTSQI